MKNHKQATTKRPFRKGKRFVFGSSRSTIYSIGEHLEPLMDNFILDSIMKLKSMIYLNSLIFSIVKLGSVSRI